MPNIEAIRPSVVKVTSLSTRLPMRRHNNCAPEILLFHTRASYKLIPSSEMDLASDTPSVHVWSSGIYLSEHAQKADQYTDGGVK